MAASRTVFHCRECGGEHAKWSGQCQHCGAWNTLEETRLTSGTGTTRGKPSRQRSQPVRLDAIATDESPRFATGSAELDRVLGGGLVPGSVVLIGGDPGIGKSTLLLQALHSLASSQKVLYVTGEESLQQVAMRAERLSCRDSDMELLAENNVDSILDTATRHGPGVMVADSIQTLFSEAIGSAPGSVTQVRECAARLVAHAKQKNCIVILVGHVTKEGALAGPRVLEHMVDTVLYFEGDRSSRFRLIRAVKNRFGAVNEIGVFAMTDRGVRDVTNPSAIFLNRDTDPAPGSIAFATWEGTRPLLVEVQALVDRSGLANPRRLAIGLDHNRLGMLLAVLHRHAGHGFGDQDVFVNLVGGVRVTEPGADLAVLLAALSSFSSRPISRGLVAFGEVGLSGELRPVQGGLERLREAAKLGFTEALVPAANRTGTRSLGIRVNAVSRLSDALEHLGF
jgi:DNA repair protein RadA/Sms